MSEPLDCAAAPCKSCPYRRDTPPGVWDRSEYQKLREYAPSEDQTPRLTAFLCHQTHAIGRRTLCRGWLTVECESLAVRLLLIRREVTLEQVDAPPPVALYETGEEAATAGMRGVAKPSPEARRMMKTLTRRLSLRRKRL